MGVPRNSRHECIGRVSPEFAVRDLPNRVVVQVSKLEGLALECCYRWCRFTTEDGDFDR